MIDKSKQLVASVKLVNNRLNFMGSVDGMQPVSIDYIPPIGDNLGYTSLELFLLSLTSCIGSSVLTFLRRMNKTITGCEINATGIRNENHPTGFKSIVVKIMLQSQDVSEADMKKVIALSEETYCPVISMIKGNVETIIQFEIKG